MGRIFISLKVQEYVLILISLSSRLLSPSLSLSLSLSIIKVLQQATKEFLCELGDSCVIRIIPSHLLPTLNRIQFKFHTWKSTQRYSTIFFWFVLCLFWACLECFNASQCCKLRKLQRWGEKSKTFSVLLKRFASSVARQSQSRGVDFWLELFLFTTLSELDFTIICERELAQSGGKRPVSKQSVKIILSSVSLFTSKRRKIILN